MQGAWMQGAAYLCFRVLDGFSFEVMQPLSSGSAQRCCICHAGSGPSSPMVLLSWSSVELPGSSAAPVSISANRQPIAQMSER
jgi:hypothetical protein